MTQTSQAILSPRKEAKQRRSKEKIELILTTTLKMLSESPADQVTTNAIATMSGISIGSLYQFFPNKEAIFYELYKRWLAQTLASLDRVYQEVDPAEGKAACVEAVLKALGGDTSLNSISNWQLRNAMASSAQLAELEATHQQEVVKRILALQDKFGVSPPESVRREAALLLNQVTIACLEVLSATEASPNRDDILNWCRKVTLLVFDFDRLSGVDRRAAD
ncbi:TetR/AcrR family transcriptional regulator [Gymnodinialimonas sp. 2305UL16-5]|uniref:TetR/AcrR family transcriptional regulator n=1 Tax=Gymnodinialimonas mytili TaxID=3126503 RepID=UPI0030B1F913